MSGQKVVVISQNTALIEGLSSIGAVTASKVEEIDNHVQAIILDDQYNFSPNVITYARLLHPTAFIVIYAPRAMDQPLYRQQAFDLNINMFAYTVK